ncbi:MAG: M23 family metallopeptidase [Methylotenera sp.]|nr:M23 family metallopeptidase [Oligoflexia bacterium]
MANRYFTVLIIPEKTSQVRRLILPSWLIKGAAVAACFSIILGGIMLLDYWYVMSQITENNQLKVENRRLRQQVQVFKSKMNTLEGTLDRVKTFSNRLKVITNLEDRGFFHAKNEVKLPDAATNIGETKMPPSIAAIEAEIDSKDPEQQVLKKQYVEMEHSFTELNNEALKTEQILQDQYELLADQKAFLAALPTRKPAVGYFTSGFGVRRSPFGDRAKMHEGLDIANHPGTPIKAPADGVVSFADSKSGYGQTLILDHGYGLETWYGHTRKILVSRGQKVRRGDTIALLGNSGRSTGPHVHYEVRVNGTPVDPLSYILEN